MTKGTVLNLAEVTLDPAQIRHLCFEGGHEGGNGFTFEVLLKPRGSIKYSVSVDEYNQVQAFARVNDLN
jgi:hypothetical protein